MVHVELIQLTSLSKFIELQSSVEQQTFAMLLSEGTTVALVSHLLVETFHVVNSEP